MQKMYFVLIISFALAISCKKKQEPVPGPVIVGREGDTCRISKVSYGPFQNLVYEYTGKRVSKIILKIDGFDYPGVLEYDADGKLTKVKGIDVDTQYEYDSKERLVKENRTLHNEGIHTLIPHWEARIFEYNEKDQVVKCSYVEGRGTDYNWFYVKKGEVYKYETYSYDFRDCVEKLESYERTPKSTTFNRTAEYVYQYDKMINPFYGNPGIYDIKMYFGADSGNGALIFSKHNVVKVMVNQASETSGYTYSSTKYPLTVQNVRWQEHTFPDLTIEYVNCR